MLGDAKAIDEVDETLGIVTTIDGIEETLGDVRSIDDVAEILGSVTIIEGIDETLGNVKSIDDVEETLGSVTITDEVEMIPLGETVDVVETVMLVVPELTRLVEEEEEPIDKFGIDAVIVVVAGLDGDA